MVDILRQVRDLLGEDDDGGARGVQTDNSGIKAKLVLWGGGESFPEEEPWALSYLATYLLKLFEEYGIEPVLDTIKELEAELEEMGLELPEYYQGGRPNSNIDQALKVARRKEARQADRREEERLRRDL